VVGDFGEDEEEVATETLTFRAVRTTGFLLHDERSGRTFRVGSEAPSRVFAGSSPACAVTLTGPAVSRRHAALDVEARGLRVTDLDSRNGTWLNGTRIYDAVAVAGDRLELGGVSLRVEAAPVESAAALCARTHFGPFLGSSAPMRRLYPLIERLAASNVPTLIEGETGTGKEILAEALHSEGPRGGRPYVVFDCTAVPANLMEAELFGYEKAAFTGAHASKPGLVELADGGTLLIDEIGELEASLQPKLLRVLDRGEVRRLGGRETKRVDVRFIAATRRNLDAEVAAGRFRDDLFHRMVVGRIEPPPLRSRQGDVFLLARHFATQLGRAEPLPDDLLARWSSHAWPGNTRELRAAVARFVSLGDEQLPSSGAELASASPGAGNDFLESVLGRELPLHAARREIVEEFERRYVARVLERTDGNVSRAAERAGIARRNFQILKARVKGGDD
jgi:DNA-binding NtrC family response regulator